MAEMARLTRRQDFPLGSGLVHYLLVASVAGLCMFWRLGGTALDVHECYVALPAQTMADPGHGDWLAGGVENGVAYDAPPSTALNHWMIPALNGHPRLEKTPLAYWCVALVARARGPDLLGEHFVDEWTARLPSAAAAVLLALVALALGRRMFSPRAALLGAVFLATSAGLQKWGRNARPEMLLCLFIMLGMGCFYFALESRRPGRRVAWMMAFWVAMGLGNLAKEFVPFLLAWPLLVFLFWRQSDEDPRDPGSLPLLLRFLVATGVGLAVHVTFTALPGLHRLSEARVAGIDVAYITMAVAFGVPMLWYVTQTRGWRQLRPLWPTALPGILLMLGTFLPWMLYVRHLFPDLADHMLAGQVIDRAGGMGGWKVDAPYKYLGAVLAMSLPWIVFLPGAFAVGLMKRFSEHRRPLVFLMLWAVGLVGLFSAAAGKREHYILPMLPALCLLMGFVAEDVFFRHEWISQRLARVIGCCCGAGGIAAVAAVAVALFLEENSDRWLPVLGVAFLAAVPTTAAGALALRGSFRPLVGLIAAAMIVAYLGYRSLVEPSWDADAPVRSLATAAARIVPAGDETLSVDKPDANLLFYFGRHILDARSHMSQPPANATPEEIQRQIESWLAEQKQASWLFARPGRARELGRLEFEPVLSLTPARGAHRVPVLFHRDPHSVAVTSRECPDDR